MPYLEAVNSATRIDVWAINAAPCAVVFRIVAEADADVLCRALNLFALQQLVPQQVDVVRADDVLRIEIVSDEQSWHRAQVIGEKLRNLVSVCEMELYRLEDAPAHKTGNSWQPLSVRR